MQDIQERQNNDDKIEVPYRRLSRFIRPGLGIVLTLLIILVIETRLFERLFE